MPPHHRLFQKTANAIHPRLLGPSGGRELPALPLGKWNSVQEKADSAALARLRGWHQATRIRTHQVVEELDDLVRALNALMRDLQNRLTPRTLATPAEIYRDLLALEEEFGGVQIEREQDQICVTTAPVVLEGIRLGRFEIRLEWRRLFDLHPYRVVALDANPASSNPAITHPHVNDGRVCEGDGQPAIAQALAQGRLFDFFTLVDRLLNSYGEGRAYVELANWHGNPCHDCASIVDLEDSYRCSRCEQTLCSDCASCCASCEEIYCVGCSDACEECDESICLRCRITGDDGGRILCPHCLTKPETIHHTLCTPMP